MEVRKVLALRGPNLWARFPVLEAWVRPDPPGDASEAPPGDLRKRLNDALPRPGHLDAIADGDGGPARVLERLTLVLQALAGTPVAFGRTADSGEPGVFRVVVEYAEEDVGRAALDAASAMIVAAIAGAPIDGKGTVERLRELLHSVRLEPGVRSIVEAARRRGIPSIRLNAEGLFQLGWGSKQRRIRASATDRTAAVGRWIAGDKELTRALLEPIGVPVPRGRLVESAEDAWKAAQEIGGPVVVKPHHGNRGHDIAANLTSREQIEAAYAAASEAASTILVERFVPGADHRVLVVGDRVVAAARCEPAQVIGDGRRTVARIVELANLAPPHDGHPTPPSLLRLDATALEVLHEQGYAPDSVPPPGARVLLRRNPLPSTGATAEDVTDRVHPEVAARCVEAAMAVGLDVAGIEVVAIDIGRPLEEQAGAIVEVIADPGLQRHVEPSSGTPRDVGGAIVDSLYPPGEDGRIPIVAVTGVNGKTTVSRLIAHLLTTAGKTVGLTCTDGIEVAGRRIESGDCSGPRSAQAIFMNPAVAAAVLETARGGILRAGLAFDRCDVGVVTNIGEGDHLGIAGIHTPEALARVKRVVVENVAPNGSAVLNASDPLVAAMAEHCRGDVVFFSADASDPVVGDHRAAGRRGVFRRGDQILLAEGTRETPVIDLAEVPLTLGGRVAFQVENVLAAVGAAWSLGIEPAGKGGRSPSMPRGGPR